MVIGNGVNNYYQALQYMADHSVSRMTTATDPGGNQVLAAEFKGGGEILIDTDNKKLLGSNIDVMC